MVSAFPGGLFHEFFQGFDLRQVIGIDVMPDTHLDRDLMILQIERNPVEGASASRQMAGMVMLFTQPVQRHLSHVNITAFQHRDILFVEKITVGDDLRAVFPAPGFRQRLEPRGHLFDHIRRQQRFPAEPHHGHIMGAEERHHPFREGNDFLLGFRTHPSRAVVLKAVRAVKVASHGRADRQADGIGGSKAHPPRDV